MRLRTVPVTFADARQFVADWHRHLRPPVGHKYSIGLANDHDLLVGVATDGTANACSALCAAAWQAAKALGYRRLVHGEPGASLRAAGWHVVAARPPRPGWHPLSRPRTSHGVDHTPRLRWQQP